MANPLRHELRHELQNPVNEAADVRPVLHPVSTESVETKTLFEQWCDDGLGAFELEDALKARAKALHAEAWAALIRRPSISRDKSFRRRSTASKIFLKMANGLNKRAVGGTIVGSIGTDRDPSVIAAHATLEGLRHRGCL